MFGYIKPNALELKVKEHELYKATYCGLCKTMGKCTGCMSNLTLSYDFAFLALMRIVADKTECKIKKRGCVAHPFKRRPMLEINETLRYCAKSSVILTRLKLKDNINDSHGFARFKAKMAGLVSIFLKKTPKDLKELESEISQLIDKLTEYEKENTDSLDLVASTFGELLGIVASYNYEGTLSKLMYDIGFHLGKWIYVIDAIDDFYDDIKKHSFNALVNSYGAELSRDTRDSLFCATILELEAMSKSVELLDFSQHREIEGIIKNVIYDGMIRTTRSVLKLDDCEKCKKA